MSKSEEDQEGHRARLVAEAEEEVKKEMSEIKTEPKTETDSMKDTTQTLPRQPADNEKTPRKTAKRHPKDTQKTENPKENNNSVSEEVLSEPKPRKEITQANLEQATAIMEIAEQLASGRSVREVVKEMGFSKTLVEKVSSGMDRSQHIHPKSARAEYLEKPYRVMMEKEQRTESQNFLSDKISSMVEDALLLSLQVQVYRDVLGLGKQKNGDDLFEKMMLAKVVGGGQSLTGKELIEFAGALKTVLTPQQSENFLDKYVQLEGIKNQSIDKYKAMQNDAFQQAKQSMDKGLLHEAIHEFAPTLNNLTKALNAPPKIPTPTPMPPPENLQLPQGEVLAASEQSLENLSLPENQAGYSNLESLRRKTILDER